MVPTNTLGHVLQQKQAVSLLTRCSPGVLEDGEEEATLVLGEVVVEEAAERTEAGVCGS